MADEYECIAKRVRAREARHGEIVEVSGVGPVLAAPGHWVVEVPGSGNLLMAPDMFEALFRPLSDT